MITRRFIQAHPTWLFVFGDNLERRGLGGQAYATRGEFNVFGVATKRAPHNAPSAFFTEFCIDAVMIDLNRLDTVADNWERVVCFPGIGEGRAQLQTRAPKLLAYIKERLSKYEVLEV